MPSPEKKRSFQKLLISPKKISKQESEYIHTYPAHTPLTVNISQTAFTTLWQFTYIFTKLQFNWRCENMKPHKDSWTNIAKPSWAQVKEWMYWKKRPKQKHPLNTGEQMSHPCIVTAYTLTWEEAYSVEILQPQDSVMLAHAAAD